MSGQETGGQFWADLRENLKNPEFRAAYEQVSAEIAATDAQVNAARETGGLRERIVSAVRTHAIDSTRNDRAQDADYCLCGALVEDWDEHWTDAALTLVQPELDAKDAQIERLTAQLVAQAEAMADLDTKATQAYEDRDAALHRAEQAEAERDKTLRDLGTANGDAEDAERERDDIANTLLAQDFATAEATARAEQAEAERDRLRSAQQRVREIAEQWAGLAPPDDWGESMHDTAIADAGRAVIAALGQGDGQETT